MRISPASRHDIARDIGASLVVFLVAVPLSMGIALASGAPIVAGLISAAVGGVVVGLLAGAPLQVSGPAAGLAVLVFGYVQTFGMETLAVLVLGAGVLQIGFGAARVARVALAISPAVIHGMLAGIGVQIALAQLHIVLGGGPQSSAVRNVIELPAQIADLHTPSAVLGLATIVLLFVWPRLPGSLPRRVPAALVAVTLTTALAAWLKLDLARVELPEDFSNAVALPGWPEADWTQIVLASVTLMFVASAESLLCAVATDRLHAGPRADLDRELLAQGVGNVCAGLLGGLPITGVIVRSTANIKAGARTRLSAILHGLWVLLFVTAWDSVLELVPLSVLAALLVFVGTQLVNPEPVRQAKRHGEASAYFVTLLGVVGINLLAGIVMGFVWAAGQLLRRRTRVQVSVESRTAETQVTLRGALTFVGVPKLTAALAQVPEGKVVRVNLDADMMDHAAFEALRDWRIGYEKSGGRVQMDLGYHQPS